MRKKCSSYREIFLQSLEQFIQTSERADQFLKQNTLLTCSWGFLRSNESEQLQFKLGKNLGLETCTKKK